MEHFVTGGIPSHFMQAVWQLVQELGLSVLYKDGEFTRQWIQRAAGLTSLPIGDNQETWLDAINSSSNAEATGSKTIFVADVEPQFNNWTPHEYQLAWDFIID